MDTPIRTDRAVLGHQQLIDERRVACILGLIPTLIIGNDRSFGVRLLSLLCISDARDAGINQNQRQNCTCKTIPVEGSCLRLTVYQLTYFHLHTSLLQ